MIRLQVIDPESRYSCGTCTTCCDQPWRTVIEADKAHALDRHDFSKYPQLAGQRFYHASADGRDGFYDLAKGEGTRCLFLGAEGLCIIHKELGAAAKPAMCRQFPFISSRTWVDERISVNFGCPSVQNRRGRSITEQEKDMDQIMPPPSKEAEPDRPIPLDGKNKLTQSENESLRNAALEIFAEDHSEDIWSRFDGLLTLLGTVSDWKRWQSCPGDDPELIEALQEDDFPDAPEATHSVASFDRPTAAPLSVRMLFAATLQPDTIPADLVGRPGLATRLLLVPKLMSLAQLSGGYASRLLNRNVSIRDVLAHPLEPGLDAESTQLLARYFRARLWQQTLVGTRLPIIAGVHQHIQDFNAILFFARAQAQQERSPRLTESHIRSALTLVEFHLANQTRLYDQTLKGWMRNQLCDISLARQSLRLMTPAMDRASPPKAHRQTTGCPVH
jgi:Fe-S-cluster containining protein